MDKSYRQRVNVGTSVKGIKTFDCTVETTGSEAGMDEVLRASDYLVAQLEKRYPVIKEDK